MGIVVEFNPDLALRHISEFQKGNREKAECIPEPLKEEKEYEFLKEGQRNYWLLGELPLLETKGEQRLSRPLASIVILEVIHFLREGKPYTRGRYKVTEVFSSDSVRFNGFEKI